MTNRDKFNKISNAELANILNGLIPRLCDRTVGDEVKYKACEFCYYAREDCVDKDCVEGIETWLNAACVNEPENPPADKHVDLQRVSEKVCDNVNHPDHYTSGKIEVIDFIEDQHLGFHLGNAVKYISRAGGRTLIKQLRTCKRRSGT